MARPRKTHHRVTVSKPRAHEGGEYRLRIFYADGRAEQRVKSGETEYCKACQRALEAEARLNNTSIVPILERYLEERGLSPNVGSAVRTMILWVRRELNIPVGKINRAQILQFQDRLRKREPPLSERSIKLHTTHLRSAWKWAWERDLVPHPWPKLPPMRVRPTRKRPYTDDEIVRIEKAIEGHPYEILIHTLRDSGRRISEVIAARPEDLRPHKELPYIAIWNVKTLEPEKAYLLPETYARLKQVEGKWLFPGIKNPGRHVTRTAAYCYLKRIIDQLGFKDTDLHSIRRYRVDQSCQNGESIARGMRITGHKSPRIFLEYQRNAHDPGIADALRRTAQRLASAKLRLSGKDPLPNADDSAI